MAPPRGSSRNTGNLGKTTTLPPTRRAPNRNHNHPQSPRFLRGRSSRSLAKALGALHLCLSGAKLRVGLASLGRRLPLGHRPGRKPVAPGPKGESRGGAFRKPAQTRVKTKKRPGGKGPRKGELLRKKMNSRPASLWLGLTFSCSVPKVQLGRSRHPGPCSVSCRPCLF